MQRTRRPLVPLSWARSRHLCAAAAPVGALPASSDRREKRRLFSVRNTRQRKALRAPRGGVNRRFSRSPGDRVQPSDLTWGPREPTPAQARQPPPPQAPRLIPVPREGRKRISFQQKKSSETAGPDFPQRGTQQVWRVCRRPCRSLSPPTGGRGSAEGSGPLPEMARACRWHSRLSPSMRRAQPPQPHRQAVLPGPESERRGPRPSGARRPRLSKQCDRCSPRLSCPCQIPVEWKF